MKGLNIPSSGKEGIKKINEKLDIRPLGF